MKSHPSQSDNPYAVRGMSSLRRINSSRANVTKFRGPITPVGKRMQAKADWVEEMVAANDANAAVGPFEATAVDLQIDRRISKNENVQKEPSPNFEHQELSAPGSALWCASSKAGQQPSEPDITLLRLLGERK